MVSQGDEHLEVYLLGQFRVSYGGELITSLNHARLQELMAYLLLQWGNPVSRQQLAFLFWQNSSEEQARTNLRNLLHRLRRALPASAQFLVVGETHLRWSSDISFFLDVLEFEDAILQAESSQESDRTGLLAQAVHLYGGDLLPECYSDWLLAERERLRQSYLSVLEMLADLYEDQRIYTKAIQSVHTLLRQDLLNENGYARLMRLYALDGNRGQALHVYHTCAEILSRELGVAPSPVVQTVYEQLLQTDAVQHSSSPAPALIGRQAEWKQLTSSWKELLRGQRSLSVILISGEAGIGKTHLAQIFIDWVQRQGYLTATAACYEGGRDLAYAPIATWLASLLDQDARIFDKLSSIWRLEISRLLPELRERDVELGVPGSLAEKWQLLHFYEALLQGFAALRSPLLLFLDDIQWCDQGTLDWLAYLQTKPAGDQVVLVATARSEVLAGDHPAMQLFTKSGRIIFQGLERLDEAETRLLVEALVAEPVEPVLTKLVFIKSEGIPLFVAEMVRAGLSQDSNGKGPLPEGIQSVINWRLNRLSEPARQVLELAAVIGRSFSYELLKEASTIEEQVLVNSLDECWRQRILREQGSQDYDFSHDMLRKVAYDGLSQARRRLLHGRVAEALEHVFHSDLDLAAEQIALHLELAGQTNRAGLFYEQAAQIARGLYALPQAIKLLEQAIRLLEPKPTSERLRARLYEQLGEILLIGGQYEVSRQYLSIALQHLEPNDTIARVRLLRLTAQTWSAQQRLSETEEAIENALVVLGNLPPIDPASPLVHEWLDIRLQQLECLYFRNQPDEMEAICKLLDRPLKQSGTLGQQANFYILRADLNNRRQRYRVTAETVQNVRHALDLAEQTNDPLFIARKHFSLGFDLLWYGDRKGAITQLEKALLQAEKLGATYVQDRALAYLSIAYRMAGSQEKVNELAQRGLASAEAEHNPIYQGIALANLAWLAYHQGDLEKVEKLAENALQLWGYGDYPFEWLADFPLAATQMKRGDTLRAQERLAATLRPTQQRLPNDLDTCLNKAIDPNGVPAREVIQLALEAASQLGYL